jgi:hypothetical protein
VAVKVLVADWFDERARARFEREIRALGRLSGHPHIVTVHEAGRTRLGNPYILMAYEEGGSLADRLAAGPPPWPEAVAGTIAVSGALAAAHRAGVLHRDVKPENVLVSAYGEPKLADFGLARPHAERPPPVVSRVTASLAHSPPEILRGEPASVASDVYSLASTAFAWIRGRPAFSAEGRPTTEMLARIASAPVPDLRPLGVPAPVCEALEGALAKDPSRRPPTVAAFARGLQDAQLAAGADVTRLVIGAAPARPWPWHDAAPIEPSAVRDDDAPTHSATVVHGARRRPATRVGGVVVSAAAVLAAGGSQPPPPAVAAELPAEIDAGKVDLSADPVERVVTLRNRARGTVEVTGAAIAGGYGHEFRMVDDRCTGRAIAPGDRCAFTVSFSPRDEGVRRARLDVALGSSTGATVALVATVARRSASRDDAPPGRCYDDAYQVGPSAYAFAGGMRALSVKQFWSPGCGAALAYVWVWKQYRDTVTADGGTWTIDLAIAGARPAQGARAGATGQPAELWTDPVPVKGACTVATASLTAVTATASASTDGRCG